MTVCIVIAAIRLGLMPARSSPASLAASIRSVSSANSGAWAMLTSEGCDTSRRGGEVGEQWPLRRRVGSRGLEQQRYGDFEAFEGVFLARRRGFYLLGRAAQRVLE